MTRFLTKKLMSNLAMMFLSSFILIAFVGNASAQAISQIQVVGNQRVEAETVKDYLSFKTGERYTNAKSNASLKSLFKTGLFKDVSIRKSGSKVIVKVEENPVIGKIAFEGNRKLNDKQLQEGISSKPRGVLTQSRVQSDVKLILESYRRLGRYDAQVNVKTIQRGDNRVDLVFEINENDKSRIRGINFVGNARYSDGELRDVMSTSEAGLLNFLSTRDVYDPDRLDADLELLRQFYLKAGYADFEILSSIAEFDREANDFYITITVDEGERYEFGDIIVDTSLEIDQSILDNSLKVSSGDIYNAEHVDETLEALTLVAAQNGYALARVRPRGNKDTENKTIDVTFYVEQGARIYIERINILGNDRTRDYVIRRELDVDEGDAYNQILIDRAKKRIQKMGIFSSVDIQRVSGSASDRIILNVNVTEKSTASLSLGGGYSTGNGFIGEVSFTERNLMGRGQILKVAAGFGSTTSNYELSFTEPRFMGRRISTGFDLYRTFKDYSDDAYYELKREGGRIRIGLLISDRLTFTSNYNLEIRDVKITDQARVTSGIKDLEGESFSSSVSYALTYNSLDDMNSPTNGYYLRAAQDVAGLGGDDNYLRSTLKATAYKPLSGSIIGIAKFEAGNIISLDDDDVSQLQTFRIGGETIRGFENLGIGPRDIRAGRGTALGGTTYWAATAETQFPFPGLSKSIGIKGAFFADAGSVYDTGNVGSLTSADIGGNDGEIRSSVGASLIWSSPFGPLRFDFAEVLTKEDSDKEQFFRFGIDTKF